MWVATPPLNLQYLDPPFQKWLDPPLGWVGVGGETYCLSPHSSMPASILFFCACQRRLLIYNNHLSHHNQRGALAQ